MTRLDINLLPRKGARELFSERWYRRVKRGSFVILGIYGLVLLAIFGGRLIMAQLTQGKTEAIQKAGMNLKQYAEVESQHLLLKKKLMTAAKVLIAQRPWGEFLEELDVAVDEGTTVRELTLEPGGGLRVKVETTSLRALVLAFGQMMTIQASQPFINVVIVETVEKTSKGYYSFSLLFASS